MPRVSVTATGYDEEEKRQLIKAKSQKAEAEKHLMVGIIDAKTAPMRAELHAQGLAAASRPAGTQ